MKPLPPYSLAAHCGVAPFPRHPDPTDSYLECSHPPGPLKGDGLTRGQWITFAFLLTGRQS